MNNIITLPLLAELFSEAVGCDRDEAQRFLLSFTNLIADGLASDGHVRIKGLGVFKRSLVKDKVRIEFVPDRDFSDFINAPFAFFEPVDLDDSVSADMLESVESKRRHPEEEPLAEGTPQDEPAVAETPQEEPAVEETHQQEPAVEETPQEEPVVEEIPQEEPVVEETPQEEPAVEETPQEEPAVEEIPQEEPVVEETPQEEPAVEETPQEEPVVEETPQEESVLEETPQEESAGEETPQEEPVVEETPREEPAVAEAPKDETIIAVAHQEEPIVEEINTRPEDDDTDEDEYEDDEDEKGSTTVWFWIAVMFVCGVLAGFAVGYFCHDTIMPTYAVTSETSDSESQTEPEAMSESETPLVEELPDSVADIETLGNNLPEPTPTESTVDAEPTVEQQQMPAVAAQQQATVYDKVTPNRTLTKMAKEHYGNKDYWVYIYMENSDVLKNPNNVKIGTELRIPPKSKYDVSTDENENIAAAKEKARELFTKYGN